MDKVGIVVCNYNKRKYVMDCVESLLTQTLSERDIYVVDNASEDDSVAALLEKYGNRITVFQNEENEGFSRAMNRGMEHCMAEGYPYILLVDNDTRFAADAVEIMKRYLEEHEEAGMCGACVLQMENPEYIQEIGGMVDYRRHELSPNYRNEKLTNEIPEEIDCDYLASCALLVKREVIEKIGIMRRDYFVYWDDIEWSRRCTDAGYSLTALRDAHVWHNWGANTVTKFNAFTEYYGRRNKLHFFAEYMEEKDSELFIENALRNMFNVIYGHYRKGAYKEMQLTLRALDDVIHNVWGKAEELKIKVDEIAELPLEKLLKSVKEAVILPNEAMGEDGGVMAIERVARFCNPDIKLLPYDGEKVQGGSVLQIKPCPHVIRTTKNILPVVWVDRFLNCILTEEDFTYFQNYETVYGLFYRLYAPFLREGVEKIRRKDNK
ncbi:MAG: glycosyltransferase family 2 protein [Lachnospiraceae bacterium]|nr:glycosyltransferase family 2 protein [Lachnospiraceae bacterium]